MMMIDYDDDHDHDDYDDHSDYDHGNDDDDHHHYNEYDRLLAQLLTGHQKTHWSNNQRLVKNLFLNK